MTMSLWKETENIGDFGTYSRCKQDPKTGEFVEKVYSVERMIRECRGLQIYSVFLKDLVCRLDIQCWRDNKGDLISPNMVLNNPSLHANEFKRILNADLTYPIILSFEKNRVCDGMHRLAKAVYEKHFYIKVFQLSEVLLERCQIRENKFF
jgi:hypothetical protein